jgi:NAD(P)-dependent dehydrogenase (short-subunit alcohol dehydrogenase family)
MAAPKTALIAGGTSGIGRSIAEALLRDGHDLCLIGRNPDKGKAVEASLSDAHPGRVRFVQLDLSDIGAVKDFAAGFAQAHRTLDLLANVAGVMEPTRKVTAEGFEKTFAVGYLSAFVLSTHLAPLLQRAANGRIANVAGVPSFVFKARLDFEDLMFSRNYKSFRTAITTVHAKTVLTEILAEKYAPMGIDVNSFHPGAVRSDLMKSMRWWTRALFTVPSLFMSKSSKTGIYVCGASELNGTSGKYFTKKKAIDLGFDRIYRDRLWTETQKLVGEPTSLRDAQAHPA